MEKIRKPWKRFSGLGKGFVGSKHTDQKGQHASFDSVQGRDAKRVCGAGGVVAMVLVGCWVCAYGGVVLQLFGLSSVKEVD